MSASQIGMIQPAPQRGADLNRSPVSRYLQLATLFRSRIRSGFWKFGQQIPTIEELMDEFGVARATIRQALGVLEDERLVARFRAKGTFVLERQPEVWCEVKTDWTGLLATRIGSTISVISDAIVDELPFIPGQAGKPAAQYRHLRRQHVLDGKPFLIADVYIDASKATGLSEAAFSEQTAMRLAASLPGISIKEAGQTVTIGSADVNLANQLEIDMNAPVAYVDRFATDGDDTIVLLALGVYRGDMFRIDISLK